MQRRPCYLPGGVRASDRRVPRLPAHYTFSAPRPARKDHQAGAQYQVAGHIEIDGAFEHASPLLHPNMNISANNTDAITHAVMLQGFYNVSVNVVALSAHYRF
jgi:hypothetical protein